MFYRIWKLISLTCSIWIKVNASRMSAALTYFTMLSLAPTLIIAVAIASYIYQPHLIKAEIVQRLSTFTTPDIANYVAGLLENASSPGSGFIAGAVSLSVLLFAASGVFTQLCDTFDDIWDVCLEGKGFWYSVQKRLVGVGMVIVVGLLLIAALVMESVIAYLQEFAGGYPQLVTWLGLADRSLSFLLMPVVFAMLFWFLPSTRIQWRDIWPSAVLTAFLVAGSRYLIGFYLKFSTTSEIYAASSTLVVLLIWVYMTSLVVFFGASFSYAWAQVYGSRSEFANDPANGATGATDSPGTDTAQGISETPGMTAQAQPPSVVAQQPAASSISSQPADAKITSAPKSTSPADQLVPRRRV